MHGARVVRIPVAARRARHELLAAAQVGRVLALRASGSWRSRSAASSSDRSCAVRPAGYVASWFAEDKLIAQAALRSAVDRRGGRAARACRSRAALLTEPTLAMAIEFAAFLQISRLCNRRTAVDYQQIAVLAFLHLIAATVLSTNLSYAALFVGFVIATPWMLALSHLRREIEGNYPAQTDADPQRARRDPARARQQARGGPALPGRHRAAVGAAVRDDARDLRRSCRASGQGFLSFRREHGPARRRLRQPGRARRLRRDPRRPDGRAARDAACRAIDQKAPRISLRLRGTSFDHYDGRRWTRSPSARAAHARASRPVLSDPARARTATTIRQLQIVLDHLDEPVVFLPAGHGRAVGSAARRRAARASRAS